MRSNKVRPKLMFALGMAILVGTLLLLVLNASGRVFAVGLCPELVEGPPPPSQGPVGQLAPTRPPPLTPPPPHTGYRPPPMDLSHLKGDRMPEEVSAAALPSKWDWRQQGVVTQVQNQGSCGSCFTFAALANFESKLQIDGAGTYNFSENNAKECNWEEVSNFEYPPGSRWGSCDGGDYFMLANLFSQKGTVLESCDPYVDRDVDCKDSCPYIKTLLDWRYISYEIPDTNVLKGYIYNHGPVYTPIYASYTEFSGYDGSYTLYHPGTEPPDHAVLIVGWDDNLHHAGGMGGWIVKNSWGTNWGDNGYFYIAYGSASIGMGSSFVYAWQAHDPSGDIMHYDEAGWWDQRGCSGSTTGWGLSRFIPTSDTYVTRVEFWTTDRTTDIDVYIYDDFDGTTCSNLRYSSLNHSFYEAGYHGVVVDPPLAVIHGDDVILVVKFTNASYEDPIPVDTAGPYETGRTYLSCSGSAGSWQDMGVDHDADVAIRLRTSDIAVPSFKVYLPLSVKNYGLPIPTPTPTARDGLWKGQSVTGGYPAETRPITFTVEARGTQIAAGAQIDTYFREEGFFTCWGTIQWTIYDPISIAGDGTFHISGGFIDELTWDGQFISSDRVEGTFHTETLAGICGSVVNDGTWWATWQGSSASPGTTGTLEGELPSWSILGRRTEKNFGQKKDDSLMRKQK